MRVGLVTVFLGLGAFVSGCPGGGGGGGGGDGGADAGPPTATLAPATLDFGTANCGGAAPPAQTVTLQNTGTGPLTYTAALDATTQFTIASGDSGTVAPGSSATISIASMAVPTSATAGTDRQATLTITTNDPAHASLTVPVKVTPQGAALTLNTMAIPFGSVPVMHATSAPFQLTNNGTTPVHVTLASSDSRLAHERRG